MNAPAKLHRLVLFPNSLVCHIRLDFYLSNVTSPWIISHEDPGKVS
ncbi:MAG TPA: hypothetical protein VGB30_08105 [bacterium]